MRLTKKKAIEISIELWTWLVETGSDEKFMWSGWEKYGQMLNDCALCEYGGRRALRTAIDCACDFCPYSQKFEECCNEAEDTPYDKWEEATDKAERKKYATEFLEQLKQL